LSERGIDHIVLERGEIANSWRTERWDSLRLLTPNWQSRLPGATYDGNDPDGFRTTPETIGFLESYAKTIAAPMQTHTRVTSLRATDQAALRHTFYVIEKAPVKRDVLRLTRNAARDFLTMRNGGYEA
jgi:putative flavoprotein involved in K+ transport